MVSRSSSYNDVAEFKGLKDIQDLLLYSKERPPYRFFNIAKRSGGERVIAAPPKLIAAFQTKILSCLTAIFVPRFPVHGFTINRSIATNAVPHVSANLVLNIDLLNFFPTIHFGRVRGVFGKHPFNLPMEVSTVLAQLCCVNSALPQGAPTSPILSNLVCRGLDRDLQRFAQEHACKCTRYADDITISTRRNSFDSAILEGVPPLGNQTLSLGRELQDIVKKHGFEVNTRKTRVKHRRIGTRSQV